MKELFLRLGGVRTWGGADFSSVKVAEVRATVEYNEGIIKKIKKIDDLV